MSPKRDGGGQGKRRLAVIGLGMAAKPHLSSLRDLADRVEVAACYTPSAERRASFAAAQPDLPASDDLNGIFADPSIAALLLLTPPFSHLDLILRAAKAGKHVLVEKPLDASVARARQAVEAMEQAKLRLGVVLQHRFRAASRRLVDLVAKGELGPLISGSAAIRWWRTPDYYAQAGRGMKARDGGGVLLTQAIHTLDLFQHLAGPIARVAAFAKTSPLRNIDTEDVVGAAIQFANGAVGTIDATTVAYPGFPERIELACERATIVLTAETLDLYYKDGRHVHEEGPESKSGGADPMAFSHEAHRGVLADFLDALDEGRDPAISGREALKVQLLIEALLRSAESGRAEKV
ncbi:MAG: Gfo/Idh/MocA family oxidoreductase [Hyphomicrobiales bacterium]|nr:Gfo/Idh/MocA family oxidoreductase [Hyphomicrobiales bacterium]